MKITTDEFTLRPWQVSDTDDLVAGANNISVWRNLRDSFPYPYTPEDAKSFLESIGKLPTVFAIEVGGHAAGSIGYFPQSGYERHCAELGYWLAEKCWGKGIMSAAVRALADYVFENTELTRLFATPYGHNTASMRVLEKAGFTKVGIMRNAEIKDGKTIDKHYYELVK